MAQVAVLGSNSFSASWFVDAALTAGHEVLGINRSPEPSPIFLPYRNNSHAKAYAFRQLDLNSDLEAIISGLQEFKPAFVVDFAGQGMVAESWARPEQWYRTNIVSKVQLHDFLRQQPWLSKYIRVSTPEVYGTTLKPVHENQPYSPSTPYAVSHAAIDMSLMAFFRNYRFSVVLTRFANFFGPGQQLYRVVPRTILHALAGRRFPLHGGGTSVRAFIHVRDAANALLQVMARGVVGETYHFSPGEFHTVREVVQTICAEMGVDFDRVVEMAADRPGKDQAYLMDSSKARDDLGWVPKNAFVDGIRETIRWVRENFREIRNLPWDYVHKT
jgi:dTDP-glucose 4,6-dehydratase